MQPRKELTKMAKKKLKPRTRNHGTLTEAGHWSRIRSVLRRSFMRGWRPGSACLQESKRDYSGSNKRQKFEYECSQCKKCHPRKEVQIDHVVEAGSLRCADDLPGFVERLFCEVDGLQVLCKKCHKVKTDASRSK